MVQAPAELTLAEFLNLPETKPASEYIDGKIVQKPMPKGKHGIIQGELTTALNAALKPTRIARAIPELRCTFGNRSTVPDIAVFTWERLPRDEDGTVADNFAIAPDWTVEILSPEQSATRVTKNILHALGHGTQLGWLVDPAERAVLVYRPQQSLQVCDRPAEVLPVPEFARAVALTVDELFGWLQV